MIIAGVRPPDPAAVARRLRERMAQADEVGEPRSGDDPAGVSEAGPQGPAEDPPLPEDAPAN